MPTYAQMQAESWWGREIVTPELDWLGDELCRRTGRPRTAAGSKGDNNHVSGAHRSQEWIKNSRYCTNRSYTVQSGLTATQARHIAGFDFSPGSAEQMIAQCKRLMAAVKGGRLEEVRELYGNVNGDQVVDGWDNLRNRAATSDSSHLWHWHISLDRRRCADRALMERILAVALGEDDDMTPEELINADVVPAARPPVANGDYDTNKHWSVGYTLMAAVEAGRAANAHAIEAKAEATKTRLTAEATLAAVKGLDTKAVLARIDQVAAAESARDAAEVQRDAELRTLVERGLSGELTAEQVVEKWRALMHAATAPQG